MEKIEIKIGEVVSKISEFYNPNEWNCSMVNGLDLGDKLEIQWFFTKYYEKNRVVCFFAYADYEEIIPSIVSIVPSAWVSESECRDLLGAQIEGTTKGLFLEDDMEIAPLKKQNSTNSEKINSEKNSGGLSDK